MSNFWNKVMKCKHKNLSSDYCAYIFCDTPYCSGWEEHCLDCGVYISNCRCGSTHGMSGWPEKRWSKRIRRM
jgi:hypothetical protein